MIGGGMAGICLLCACMKGWSSCRCCSCRCRRFRCVKKCLRFTGWDKFDDFELILCVHEVTFEKTKSKITTRVRIDAGGEKAVTDLNSKGIFQQSFHLNVEQGTRHIRLDLLDSG